LRQNPLEVVASVMQWKRDFLAGQRQDREYQERIVELLSKPVEPLEERRKSLLKKADWDSEMFYGSELLERVRLLLHQPESDE
jgi:hypothetical protein